MSAKTIRPQSAPDGLELHGKGHGAKHQAVRERAILALLSEKTLGAAADKAHIGERTLRRWLTENPDFRIEYDIARRATFQAGINRVQALMGKAVDTLEDLLSTDTAPAVRLGAARTMAEIALHQHDADTILRTLDEIEQRQQGRY